MKKMKLIIMTALIFGLVAGNCLALNDAGIDIHGFVSQGYLKSDTNNWNGPTEDGTFQFNEFGINFSTELTDKLRVGMQLFAKDLGDTGNDEVKIDWAYGDYRLKDWLGFRAGLLKAPHGLFNETRDVDMLRTSIFLPQSVYPEILRSVTLSLQGAGIYGNVDLNQMGGFTYQAMVGTQDIDQNGRTADYLMGVYNPAVANDGFDVDTKYALALLWDTPLSGLRLSATLDNTKLTANQVAIADVGDFMTIGDTITVEFEELKNVVYSAEYTWNDLILVGEYIRSDKEYAIIEFGGVPEYYTSDGWYVGGSYRFSDWFELGSYYSEAYRDVDDRDGENWRGDAFEAYHKDICLSARFDINSYMTFKLENHWNTGTLGVSISDNYIEGAQSFFEKDWNLFAAKVTFSF